MNPLVSVIMPVGNDISYLQEAVDSILNQTYKNIELIIVYATTEQYSVDKLHSFKDKRIRLFYREKNGIWDALNYGISMAKGRYIARMDADDVSKEERLEKQVEFLESNPEIGILGTSYECIDGEDNILCQTILPSDSEKIEVKMLFANVVAHPTVMFRREIFEQGWKYENVVAEDYDFWTRLLPTIKFSNLTESLFFYRVHGESESKVHYNKVVLSDQNSTSAYIKRLFNIEVEKYHSIDFIKTDYIENNKEIIFENNILFGIRQLDLLYELFCKNRKHNVVREELLIEELENRWKLVSCLMGFSQIRIKDIFENSYENYRKIIEKRILDLSEARKHKSRFLIYSMGKMGNQFLDRCNELAKEELLLWNLEGIIDKRNVSVQFGNNEYVSFPVEEVINKQFDYIVIPSVMFYQEMKQELLRVGIDENKIITDVVFYS